MTIQTETTTDDLNLLKKQAEENAAGILFYGFLLFVSVYYLVTHYPTVQSEMAALACLLASVVMPVSAIKTIKYLVRYVMVTRMIYKIELAKKMESNWFEELVDDEGPC